MTNILRNIRVGLGDALIVTVRVSNGGIIGLMQSEEHHLTFNEFIHDVYQNQNVLRKVLQELVTRFQKNDANKVSITIGINGPQQIYIYHEWSLSLFEHMLNYDDTMLVYHTSVVMYKQLEDNPDIQQMFPKPVNDTDTNMKYPWNWKK